MARILIVDDEPEITALTGMMLKGDGPRGHSIDEAESGEVCLKKLKKEKYDLILLDVRMPGEMAGISASRSKRIRRQRTYRRSCSRSRQVLIRLTAARRAGPLLT